ncbi:hypothetical protein CK934_24535 [Chitinophaga sp. MD30]|nr:hypothetical protein CK934_24535 [Chitinophaga sp. MD30]
MLENYFRDGVLPNKVLYERFLQMVSELGNCLTNDKYSVCETWLPLVAVNNNMNIREKRSVVCWAKQNSS